VLAVLARRSIGIARLKGSRYAKRKLDSRMNFTENGGWRGRSREFGSRPSPSSFGGCSWRYENDRQPCLKFRSTSSCIDPLCTDDASFNCRYSRW